MTPKAVLHNGGKGTVKRCEYFIKCCNCSELLSARDFPKHTGELDLHQSSNQWIYEAVIVLNILSITKASKAFNPADLTPLAANCSWRS